MRALPRNIDADAVIAIGRYLDDHGSSRPVSVHDAVAALRQQQVPLSDAALEELVVEMCSTRRLAVLFDRRGSGAASPEPPRGRSGA